MLPNMGEKQRHTTSNESDYPSRGIAQSLFSEVQLKVLALLFGQPDRKFQMSELIILIDSGVGAVHRIVKRLTNSRLVNEERIGRTKFYQANSQSPVFHEIHGLVIKTVALTIPLESALAPFMNSIFGAFIYGSIANGKDNSDSDIDIIVIGEGIQYSDLLSALQPVENDIRRTISVRIMTLEEWKNKVEESNPFVQRVLAQPKIFLKGSEYAIREP